MHCRVATRNCTLLFAIVSHMMVLRSIACRNAKLSENRLLGAASDCLQWAPKCLAKGASEGEEKAVAGRSQHRKGN